MAGSYNTIGPPSDLRLKTALRPIRHGLDSVRRLQGWRFRWSEAGVRYFTRDVESSRSAGPDATESENQQLWKAERQRLSESLSGEEIGLVAQEVEGVVPPLVQEDGDGYKHVRYQQLTALLVEAIKEEAAVVEALSARVAALEVVGDR